MNIIVISRDITKTDSMADCIVNAANESLLGGGGVDGAIHAAAGPKLLEECRSLGGCRPGEAKATKAYNLPHKYIIHTVGPRYYETKNPADVLRRCYENSLKLADDLGCVAIAFPSIATGVFGYPMDEAAEICAKTVFGFKGKSLQKAYLCVLPGDRRAFEAYSKAFEEYRYLTDERVESNGRTLMNIIDETKSFDFALRPFLLMFLNGEIERERLLNRLAYFGLHEGLEGLTDIVLKEIVQSMDEQIEKSLSGHITKDEWHFPLETLHEFWETKLAYPDGCDAPEKMPKDIDDFYFGKPPFYIGMDGSLIFDPIFVTRGAYESKRYQLHETKSATMNKQDGSYSKEMKTYNRNIDDLVSQGSRTPNYFVMDHTQKMCSTHPVLAESIRRSIETEAIYKDPGLGPYTFAKGGNPNGSTRKVIFSKKRSFEAARAYTGKKVVVLNFANNVHVGGSPWGANAQEECLCRISTLYPCLQAKDKEYYAVHQRLMREDKMDDMGNSDIIYTPGVTVFKTDELAPKLLPEDEWYSVDVITCAAPILDGDYDKSNYRELMKHRINWILSVAKANGAEVLILGAFGCGAFKNPPRMVAELFNMWLREYRFETVEFAIYDSRNRPDSNYNIFRETFIECGLIEVI